MPELKVNGGVVSYKIYGSGTVPVVLTPGGRWAGYVQERLALALAEDFRVITWDRRNTDGAATFCFKGDLSEADLWAEDLAVLIETLGLGPCYVGEYAGCRTTPLLSAKRPELVCALMLAWPSGGATPAESVPRTIYRPYIRAALRNGMEGVCALEPFARSIASNPLNGDQLRAMEPTQFIRQMTYWEAWFTTTGDLATAGCRLTDEEWSSIRVPVSVTGGVDPVHPTAAAQRIAQLIPNASLHAPVVTEDEWSKYFGVLPYPKTSEFQSERIAPVWAEFIRRLED